MYFHNTSAWKYKTDTPTTFRRLWLRTGTPTDMLPVTRKRKVRSKFRWLTGFCNSHYVSHFAAFFIVVGAKTSVAESVCDALFFAFFVCGCVYRDTYIRALQSVWDEMGFWKPEAGFKKKVEIKRFCGGEFWIPNHHKTPVASLAWKKTGAKWQYDFHR